MTHATLTQAIAEQAGTDPEDAERLITALVFSDALVRNGDAFTLPPVDRGDAA